MSATDGLFYLVIGTALAFDFTNGFHDTANAMATTIATRALPPRVAVTVAALLNFAGAFLSLKVATTIAKGIVSSSDTTLNIVFAALIGAIAWNLITWYFGIPSSSSHALIGGLVGATWAAGGSSAVHWHGLVAKVIIPAFIAPFLAAAVAIVGTFLAYRLVARVRDRTSTRGYRLGQIGSSSLVSLAHGTNDAQKTMGIITLALVAHGNLSSNASTPDWVIISAATSIAIGTWVGGWRVIRTMGRRITDIEPPQGFSAGSSAATVILASSYFGYPLSTTQVVGGSVVGSGIGKRLAAVRWGVARRIVLAWLITLPAAALGGAAVQRINDAFGNSTAIAVAVAVAALAGGLGLWRLSRRTRVDWNNVNDPVTDEELDLVPHPTEKAEPQPA
jgi:inorganic phosphate transporter, PiT family